MVGGVGVGAVYREEDARHPARHVVGGEEGGGAGHFSCRPQAVGGDRRTRPLLVLKTIQTTLLERCMTDRYT